MSFFFASLTKKIGVNLIRSHQMAIVVLAVVIFFLFDNLRETRSVPLTESSDAACFKNSCGAAVCCGIPVENHWLGML